MARHLYTLPIGPALPTDLTGLPEGWPFVLTDGDTFILHILVGGEWRAAALTA